MIADLRRAREAAEAFRAEHITGRPYDRFPVDVFFIADNILRLDLIPISGLCDLIDECAAIKPNLRELYVDDDLFAAYGDRHAKRWELDRLRFSIAHEIGHICLHAEHVGAIRCHEIEDLQRLFNSDTELRHTLEKEANEFAGRLIVPLGKLEETLTNFGRMQSDPRWRDSSELRGSFCDLAGRMFGLNARDGMRTRLDREAVWPAEWTMGG